MPRAWLFLGPSFVAAVAYIDPGNFATNIQAGSETGYRLVSVVIAANITAIVVQIQSAELGLVSGRNLPEHIRDRAHVLRPRRSSTGDIDTASAALATLVENGIGDLVCDLVRRPRGNDSDVNNYDQPPCLPGCRVAALGGPGTVTQDAAGR